MTIRDMLFASSRQVFLPVVFLLMSLQLLLFFMSLRDGRSRGVRSLLLLWFGLQFGLFYLLMMDVFCEIIFPERSRPFTGVLAALLNLPAEFLILLEAVNALCQAAVICELYWFRRTHPTLGSIKEALDLLPAGIAIGRQDGTAVLSNLAMNRLSRALTGKNPTDLTVLARSTENTEAGPLRFTSPGGAAAWQLTRQEIPVDGVPCIQLTATDITAEAAIEEELREKNKKLRELHLRLDLYNRQADRIVIAQELLTARMAVHNEVGNVLLESRRYLQEPTALDEEKLLQALRHTNTYLLREYEQDDTVRDPLTDALEMAEAIGVDVMITGRIPSAEPCRSLLGAAITECASNTVKHANGDRLEVKLAETAQQVAFTLCGNGDAPREPIVEAGGLRSLRALIEAERGSIAVESAPAVRLKITLPRARNYG